MSQVVVRIAPSPTGDPHVGTAYIALFNYVFARKHGGRFILRIEDTDRARSTVESERAILRALRWLGLEWDEGPDVGGPAAPYRQSDRTELYQRYTRELLEKGRAYYCFCTAERLEKMRKEQQSRGQSPMYDRLCLSLTEAERQAKLRSGEKAVVRLRIPDRESTAVVDALRGEVVIKNNTIDDQVLLKSDGFPTYHLANVVDDHLMGVTHVIRAEEWLVSTPKHVILYEAFGWEPPVWVHMPLLRNADKSKISKRKNPTSLDWYKAEGYLPEALVNFLGLMGFSMPGDREVFSIEEMVREFTFERIALGGPVFDLEKLAWLNGVYIRRLSADELARRLCDGFVTPGWDQGLVRRSIPLVQERLRTLKEYADRVRFIFEDLPGYDPALLIPAKKGRPLKTPAETREALDRAAAVLGELADWTSDAIEQRLRILAEETGWKPADLFMALRVAVTGSTVSPPLTASMEVLGRERSVRRIAEAAERL